MPPKDPSGDSARRGACSTHQEIATRVRRGRTKVQDPKGEIRPTGSRNPSRDKGLPPDQSNMGDRYVAVECRTESCFSLHRLRHPMHGRRPECSPPIVAREDPAGMECTDPADCIGRKTRTRGSGLPDQNRNATESVRRPEPKGARGRKCRQGLSTPHPVGQRVPQRQAIGNRTNRERGGFDPAPDPLDLRLEGRTSGLCPGIVIRRPTLRPTDGTPNRKQEPIGQGPHLCPAGSRGIERHPRGYARMGGLDFGYSYRGQGPPVAREQDSVASDFGAGSAKEHRRNDREAPEGFGLFPTGEYPVRRVALRDLEQLRSQRDSGGRAYAETGTRECPDQENAAG